MKFKQNLIAPIKLFKMIGRYEPLYMVLMLPKILLSAVLPILYVYFPKLFIEKLTNGEDYRTIIQTVLLYVSILLVVNMTNSVLSNKTSFLVDRFSKKLREETGRMTMSLTLEHMEGAGFNDKLAMANNITQIISVADILQNIIASIITILGLAVIITRLDFVFIILVCVILGIKTWFVRLTYKYNEKRRQLYASNDRVANYLNGITYFNQGAAKEIRINNLDSWFMSKVKETRNEMLRLQYSDFRRVTLFESITAVIMAFQAFVIIWVLAIRFVDGTISIADFTMYFSAVTVLTTSLASIVEHIGEYNRQQLILFDFNVLRGLNNKTECNSAAPSGNRDIVFENVSFAYPNTERKVLKDINICIPFGEKLSIVGQNGAGKSTFIKLLCKFYRPISGKITIGGKDIWQIENDEYVKIISAVFQDYENFSFTLGENVSMGQNDEQVMNILKDVGLGKLIAKLPNGADTYLSRSFEENGIELSGGEGQKLAIARAVYRNTSILILDEPTASLDPKAESEVYDSFFKIAKSKTTIFISHRLASSTRADKIAVFEGGKIIEYGTHDKLIEQNNKYAEMFNMQKKSYVNGY